MHNAAYYEEVFKGAGLKVRFKTTETTLDSRYRPVVAWALA